MSDPYKVLGISRDASDDEVKKAYRTMSRKYHPDANINNPNKEKAEEMFKLVQQAYEQIMRERSGGHFAGNGAGSYGRASGSSSGGSYYGGGSDTDGYGGFGQGSYGWFGGFGPFGMFGTFGNFSGQRREQQAAGEDEESIRLRAAANYIQNRRFQEALNTLKSIDHHSAQWYYYSAIANSGLGNNVAALKDAQTAAQMEPGNRNYQELVSSLQSGGTWYGGQRTVYGSPAGANDACTRLCLTWFLCSCCCGGGGRYYLCC